MTEKRRGHSKGSGKPLTDAMLLQAKIAVEAHGSMTAAAADLGIARQTLSYRYRLALQQGIQDLANEQTRKKPSADGKSILIEYKGCKIETPEALLDDCDIDLKHWYISDVKIKNYEQGGKIKTGDETAPEKLWAQPLRSITVALKRKKDERLAFEEIIREIQDKSPIVPKIKYPKPTKKNLGKRMLELTIMDPHLGLHCFPPEADHAWSLDDCEAICMWAIDSLLRQAEVHYPIDEIVFPFGNDFLHHDNLFHTTTAGTGQPEGMPYHTVYKRGIDLAIAMIDRMKEVAPVRVYQIPGNHDKQSSYTLGHVLWAYYHNDANVVVDASSETYKFHRYGTNLIGYEHGHSIGAIRLAALMANECSGPGRRQGWWDQTTYREWHLGDQHRKGSSKPSTFEEQGVSIEYLPGLTPPNEWHRTKSYNWQKRGAMAFVWDHDRGPVSRLQVNLNSYTGAPTGMSVRDVKKLFESKK